MKLDVEILGTDNLMAKLTELTPGVKEGLKRGMSRGMVILQRAAKQNLSGPVLKNRTGTGRRSVNYRVWEEADAVYGATGTNVSYLRTHELGLTIPAHDIYAKNAKALKFYWPNGPFADIVWFRKVHIPAVTMPKRSWLASAFRDNRASIFHELQLGGELGARSVGH